MFNLDSGMFMDFGILFKSALKARDRVLAAPGEPSTEDVLTTIIFANVSAEGFINEIAEAGRMMDKGFPPMNAFGNLIEELETDKGSTLAKYYLGSCVLGKPFVKGENPFQDFRCVMPSSISAKWIRPLNG